MQHTTQQQIPQALIGALPNSDGSVAYLNNPARTSSPTDMQTELDERATLVALRATMGPVKAEARSLATRASVQAAKVFMISVGRVGKVVG